MTKEDAVVIVTIIAGTLILWLAFMAGFIWLEI
jgi:hypothetical protein